MTLILVSKVGPKGQVVLKKGLREQFGIKEGMLVEERVTVDGILIKPVEAAAILRGIEDVAKSVSRKWPKGLGAAEAVRGERR